MSETCDGLSSNNGLHSSAGLFRWVPRWWSSLGDWCRGLGYDQTCVGLVVW